MNLQIASSFLDKKKDLISLFNSRGARLNLVLKVIL